MQAVGSVMTNKYSEGYPGARYYGGNEYDKRTIHTTLLHFSFFFVLIIFLFTFPFMTAIQLGTLTWPNHYVRSVH